MADFTHFFSIFIPQIKKILLFMKFICVLVGFFIACSSIFGQISEEYGNVFVGVNGTDKAECGDRQIRPCKTIKYVVDSLSKTILVEIIHVAEGTFDELPILIGNSSFLFFTLLLLFFICRKLFRSLD
jgi:hypothetical protein